ncbi:MAG: hypothetical protein COB66_05235 [Coxiella sp. (in: Bacteria)]|nr:MAG: hypothetical protein COB66_05235 [Coxiella sp. (in: g-proteobacteria)]
MKVIVSLSAAFDTPNIVISFGLGRYCLEKIEMIMKQIKLRSTEQLIAEDQIRRGLSCLLNFQHIEERPWGWATPDIPVATYTLSRSGQNLFIELLYPDPAYEECESAIENVFVVDLSGTVFVDDETIDALAEHLIYHQNRFNNPCDNHPEHCCSDCHLRMEPCRSGGDDHEG